MAPSGEVWWSEREQDGWRLLTGSSVPPGVCPPRRGAQRRLQTLGHVGAGSSRTPYQIKVLPGSQHCPSVSGLSVFCS